MIDQQSDSFPHDQKQLVTALPATRVPVGGCDGIFLQQLQGAERLSCFRVLTTFPVTSDGPQAAACTQAV